MPNQYLTLIDPHSGNRATVPTREALETLQAGMRRHNIPAPRRWTPESIREVTALISLHSALQTALADQERERKQA